MSEPVQPLSESEVAAAIAARQAGSGGQTESDVNAIVAQLQAQMAAQAAQIKALQVDAGQTGEAPLLASARQLQAHLADSDHKDSHKPAAELASALVAAASKDAPDHGEVSQIIARLQKWAHRNPPPPGDSYHAQQADQLINYHLEDHADALAGA